MFKISVIIPTYNRGSVIVRAVNSVLRQSLPPFETIIVDDGSTDNTFEQLQVFGKSIRYFRTDNNGVSSARNFGILAARGNWIAFLDSDDIWHRQKLEVQVSVIRETGVMISFCRSSNENCLNLDDYFQIEHRSESAGDYFLRSNDASVIGFDRHWYVQSMIVRRDLLINVGMFDENLFVAEDTHLIYSLTFQYPYVVINRILVGVCRQKHRIGLSNNTAIASVLLRSICYRIVQELAIGHCGLERCLIRKYAHRRIKYFCSLEAKAYCQLGYEMIARKAAVSALSWDSSLNTRFRCMLIILCPTIARKVFNRKKLLISDGLRRSKI